MDFTPAPEQLAVADVVNAALERENSWESLTSAGVSALGVPDRLGGDGVGLPEIAAALTAIGRHGTVSPALATLGLALVPLLDLAGVEQQDRFLTGVAKGGILSAALDEPGAALPDHPAVVLQSGRLNGTKVAVSYAAQADWLLVTADSGVAVIAPDADGVRLVQTPSSTGAAEFSVTFVDAAAEVIDGAAPQRVNRLALAMIGAFTSGLVSGALRLTADYVAQRHQFGRPLSTFQTVAAQLAEVYIASRTVDLIATSAVWRLAEGLDAEDDLAVLGYWITSQVPPMMQICHHLHGGMGMDVTYPMHRYYSSVKDLTRLLGGPSRLLDSVGAQCTSN